MFKRIVYVSKDTNMKRRNVIILENLRNSVDNHFQTGIKQSQYIQKVS